MKKIFWHDGTVDAIRLNGPTRRKHASLELDVSLYPTDVSPERVPFTLVCGGLHLFDINGDAAVLRDNSGAGNIVDGAIVSSGEASRATIELTGGMLVLKANKIQLKRRSS
jgi:hypothetical protein